MPVIRAAEVESHLMHGSTFTPLVRPTTGSAELCVWRLEIAPGTKGVAHRINGEEAFVLLSGDITITIEGETSPLAPGDAAVAPAGSIISLANLAEIPATVMVTAPVGFTGELLDGTIVNPPWVN
ncbi:cupin domain-containing protein [Nocardia sp. SYP-A9097]|uniref:cupin domain-containing protein n=1 Tax=Nocardia sp. SYP-A9097 TaxID=2663237 RepID=UPI00129A0E75|nr:cupin domain-containing protein [Nocardia sp. SYP-A9097]MRH92105.1 cupin domain-containing protein [Nocardia sp. SYP-A9097]